VEEREGCESGNVILSGVSGEWVEVEGILTSAAFICVLVFGA
jgi:hypothetical protein